MNEQKRKIIYKNFLANLQLVKFTGMPFIDYINAVAVALAELALASEQEPKNPYNKEVIWQKFFEKYNSHFAKIEQVFKKNNLHNVIDLKTIKKKDEKNKDI